MRDNVYVDTSFFIATQITNHPFHKNAVDVLGAYKDSPFYFSLLTIDEIVFTLLHHKVTPEEISNIITDKIIAIRNSKLIAYHNNMKQIKDYVDFWKNTNMQPRDAMHAYLMKLNRISKIATFDSDFKRNQKKLNITVIGLPEVKQLHDHRH